MVLVTFAKTKVTRAPQERLFVCEKLHGARNNEHDGANDNKNGSAAAFQPRQSGL